MQKGRGFETQILAAQKWWTEMNFVNHSQTVCLETRISFVPYGQWSWDYLYVRIELKRQNLIKDIECKSMWCVLVCSVLVGGGDDADVPMRSPRHLSPLFRANNPNSHQWPQPSTTLCRLSCSHPYAQRAAVHWRPRCCRPIAISGLHIRSWRLCSFR